MAATTWVRVIGLVAVALAPAAAAAQATASAPAAPSAVLSADSVDGGLTFALGRSDGLTLGRRAIVLDGGEPVGWARIGVLSDALCTLVWDGPAPAGPLQAPGAIFPPDAAGLRDRSAWPAGVIPCGGVGEVAADQATAVLSGPGAALLQPGDAVLIWQAGLPVARGDGVARAAAAAADPTVRLAALVAGRSVHPGDAWTLLRRDDPAGLLSAVLQVSVEAADTVLLLAANEADGAKADRQAVVVRGAGLLAVGTLDEVGQRLAEAIIVPAFLRQVPVVGDRAWIEPAPARRGWLFRVDGDYGLATLPEDSGVRVGQQVGVYRAGARVADLTVEAVKEGYVGGRLSGGAAAWDEVWPANPPATVGQLLTPTKVEALWWARAADGATGRPGRVVGLFAESLPVGAGVVVYNSNGRFLVWLTRSYWQAGAAAGQTLRGPAGDR